MMANASETTVFTKEDLLEHWQGHRRLTRLVIEAFPEDKIFTFTLGGMRPFGEMAFELLKMTIPIANGVATGKWEGSKRTAPSSKAELLKLWDEDTAALNAVWPTIPAPRFAETDKAFGQWECTGAAAILYGLDNEIHHRGQAYVYLRSLGITPPSFWDGRK
jgi:uncharacterized damage-inducible protein DinB